jgi:hypothetical protein
MKSRNPPTTSYKAPNQLGFATLILVVIRGHVSQLEGCFDSILPQYKPQERNLPKKQFHRDKRENYSTHYSLSLDLMIITAKRVSR